MTGPDLLTVLRTLQTTEVSAAEGALATFHKQPVDYINTLVKVTQTAELEVTTRQMAAVLLREALVTKPNSIFTQLPVQFKLSLKQQLPQWILAITDTDIRRRVTECLSVYLSSLKQENQDWPELLPWLMSLSQSEHPAQRELSYVALTRVATLLFPAIRSNISHLRTSFSTALQDPSGEVRLAAVRALTAVVTASPEVKHVKVLRELLPQVLTTIGHLAEALSAQFNDNTAEALEVLLVEIAEIAELRAKFVQPMLNEFSAGMMSIAANYKLTNECRNLALEVVILFCESLPKSIRQNPTLLRNILTLILTLMCDIENPDDWEQLEPSNSEIDEDSVSFASERALDRLALSLGGLTLPPSSRTFNQTTNRTRPMEPTIRCNQRDLFNRRGMCGRD
ncbi:hypothetical protein GEMRC1_008853 [Eukaryota sp. GEM-RC1]